MDVRVDGQHRPEALRDGEEDLMDLARDHSPVCNTVCNPVPVTFDWTQE